MSVFAKAKKKTDPVGGISFPGEDPAASGGSGTYAPSEFLGGGVKVPPNPYQDFTWGGGSLQGIARYYDGDQFLPYNWDDGSIAELQSALIAAGYLSAKTVRAGIWDDRSASALKDALSYANNLGIPVDQLLARLADGNDVGGAGGRGGGGGGGGGGLGAAGVTDEDITALANEVAQSVLGRNLRTEEIGGFIPAFRGALTTGTTPKVSAENLIRQDTAPAEAGAHDVGTAMQALSKMLGG